MANKQTINPVTGQFQLLTDPANPEFDKLNLESANPEIKQTVTGGESITGTKSVASNKYTLTDRVIKAAGVGGALSFDGIDDYCVGSTGYNFSSSEDHSFDFWFYRTVDDVYPAFIYNTNFPAESAIWIYEPNQFKWVFKRTEGIALLWVATNSLSAWHHCVFTYKASTQKANFYLDGVQQTEQTVSGTWAGGTTAIRLGYGDCFLGNFLKGL